MTFQIEYPRVWNAALPQRAHMVDEPRGSPEWARIRAKLWCSLPSAQLTRVQRVQNPKLWGAFVGPLAEFRDTGGSVRVDHDSSSVREVWKLPMSRHRIKTPLCTIAPHVDISPVVSTPEHCVLALLHGVIVAWNGPFGVSMKGSMPPTDSLPTTFFASVMARHRLG